MSTATVGGRLTSPTGRLVLPSSAPRSDWLAARRDGITATDLVGIIGQSNYTGPADVWLDKTSDFPVSDDGASEAAMWGLDFEDDIALRWAERHSMKVRRVGLLAKDGDDWMRASLDRLVTPGCNLDGMCGLEIKTRNAFVADQWATGIPASVATQVQWQMAVTGLGHIHVAALIGGQRLVEYTVERDEERIDELTAAGARFWACVLARELPEIDPATWTPDQLDKLFPNREGIREVGDAAYGALSEYDAATKVIATYIAAKELARTKLVALLGDGEVGCVDGVELYTYKQAERTSVDAKALRADWPDAYAATAKTTTSRTFRVTRKGKS